MRTTTGLDCPAHCLKGYALLAIGNVSESVATLLEAAKRVSGLGNAELLADVVAQLVIATSYAPQERVAGVERDGPAALAAAH